MEKKKRDSTIEENNLTTMEDETALYESVWEFATAQPTPPKRTASIRPESKKKRYDISDFKLLKILGKGSFGKVNFFDIL